MAKKAIYTKKLGSVVANDAKGTAGGQFHVISSLSDKWVVVSDGTVKPIKAFATQKEAVLFAKQYATSKPVHEVVIHGRDGRVMERISR